jgi:pimeloyl-ACP methyl ester carboxylesterase
VELDAAYGKERLTVHLFLPKEAGLPYQPVIHWPGLGASHARAIASPFGEKLAFLVQSGRALVWPIYKGTYDRRLGPGGDLWSWESRVQQVNDLRRTVDYLQTRNDIGAGAVGYYGISWGASDGLLAVAVENRIKAAVLIDGGLWLGPIGRPQFEVRQYLPRIKIPVLMLNGEYDTVYPPEESQKPMFRLLGSDPDRKAYRLFKSSHVATPMTERIRETVGWFDRHLGPVNQKRGPGSAP